MITAGQLAEIINSGRYGGHVRLKKVGADRFVGFCPFHGDGRRPSLSIFAGRRGEGRYHCLGTCGSDIDGDGIDWLIRMEQKTFQEAGGRLLDRQAIERRDQEKAAQRRRESILAAYHDRNPDCCCPEFVLRTE